MKKKKVDTLLLYWVLNSNGSDFGGLTTDKRKDLDLYLGLRIRIVLSWRLSLWRNATSETEFLLLWHCTSITKPLRVSWTTLSGQLTSWAQKVVRPRPKINRGERV